MALIYYHYMLHNSKISIGISIDNSPHCLLPLVNTVKSRSKAFQETNKSYLLQAFNNIVNHQYNFIRNKEKLVKGTVNLHLFQAEFFSGWSVRAGVNFTLSGIVFRIWIFVETSWLLSFEELHSHCSNHGMTYCLSYDVFKIRS